MSPDEQAFGRRSRRDFMQGLAALPALALSSSSLPGQDPAPAAKPAQAASPHANKLVAIQIGGRSFVDETVDGCLDTLQQTGAVNTLMSTVFTYGTGLAGRQVRGVPLPDHGVKEYDRVHGGSFTRVHPEFYTDSPIRDIRAPESESSTSWPTLSPKPRRAVCRPTRCLRRTTTFA